MSSTFVLSFNHGSGHVGGIARQVQGGPASDSEEGGPADNDEYNDDLPPQDEEPPGIQESATCLFHSSLIMCQPLPH